MADALTSVQFPSTRQISYGYEAATNRVSSVTGTQGTASTSYALSPISYFAHGGLNSMTLGNGLVESWIFNEALQPVNINLGTTSGSSNVMGLSLVYCPVGGCTATNGNNGNVLSQTIQPLNVTQNYTYDGVNRIGFAGEGAVWSQNCVYNNAFGNCAVLAGSHIPNPGSTPQVQGANSERSRRCGNHRIGWRPQVGYVCYSAWRDSRGCFKQHR